MDNHSALVLKLKPRVPLLDSAEKERRNEGFPLLAFAAPHGLGLGRRGDRNSQAVEIKDFVEWRTSTCRDVQN